MKTNSAFLAILVVFLIGASMFGVSLQAHGQSSDSLSVWVAVDGEFQDAVQATLNSAPTSVSTTILDKTTLEDQLLDAKLNGSMPDAVVTDSELIPGLVGQGTIQAVTKSKNSDIYPSVQRTTAYYELNDLGIIISDSILYYGVPFIAKTVVLFQNTKLWANEIESLDDFYEAALKSNDQTNPADPKYGFAFIDMPDPAFALFYGNGARIFDGGIIDTTHLQITEPKQVGTFSKMYEMAKLRKLTPSWEEQGTINARKLFHTEGRVALIIDNSFGIKEYKESSVFGSSLTNLKAQPVPGDGAPIRSISLIPTSVLDENGVKAVEQLGNELLSKEIQSSLWSDYSILPARKGILKGEEYSPEEAFDETLDGDGFQLPINKKWLFVEEVFSREVSKLLKGDQNHTRTALAIDVSLRIGLPQDLAYDPIPPVGEEGKSGFLSSTGMFVAFVTSLAVIAFISVRKRRR